MEYIEDIVDVRISNEEETELNTGSLIITNLVRNPPFIKYDTLDRVKWLKNKKLLVLLGRHQNSRAAAVG